MSYATFHWRMFNVSMRLVGMWFVLGGAGFLARALVYKFAPASAGIPTLSGSPAVDFAAAGLIALVIGVVSLKVRPYRPDLSKSAARLNWWNGDPIADD